MSDQNTDINFNEAWQGLKPQLDAEAKRREKKKRRIIFFWFSAAIIVAAGIGVYLNGQQSKGSQQLAVNSQQSTVNSRQPIVNDKKSTESKATLYDKKASLNEKENKDLDDNSAGLKNNNKKANTQEKTNNNFNNSKTSNNNLKENKSKRSVLKQVINPYEKDLNLSTVYNKVEAKARTNNQKTLRNKNIQDINKKTKASITKGLVLENRSFTNNNNKKPETAKNSSNDKLETKNESIEEQKIVATNNNKKQETRNNSSNEKQETRNSSSTNNNLTNSSKPQTPNQKLETRNISYGLQFTAPVFFGANSYDLNAQQQPLSLIIPSIYVAKTFNQKHTVQLSFNPNAQYFVNNRTIASTDVYNVTTQNGNNSNNVPTQTKYQQTLAYNKLLSFELGISYQYQIKPKIQIGFGLYSNWLQGAVVQNSVTENDVDQTKKEFIGLEKSSTEWKNITSNFYTAKLEAKYNFKKFNVGLSVVKPLQTLFENTSNNLPINTNLFLQFKLK